MTNTPPHLRLAKTAEDIARATASVEAAVEDIRAGKMVILVDDVDRENEGDLCMAAERATPEAINITFDVSSQHIGTATLRPGIERSPRALPTQVGDTIDTED